VTKKKRYTARYILGLITLPFLVVGYFFRKVVWGYLSKKKPLVEWTVLVLSIVIVILVVSGIIRGDFKSGKNIDGDNGPQTQFKKKKH